jgi:hypothetical protein
MTMINKLMKEKKVIIVVIIVVDFEIGEAE